MFHFPLRIPSFHFPPVTSRNKRKLISTRHNLANLFVSDYNRWKNSHESLLRLLSRRFQTGRRNDEAALRITVIINFNENSDCPFRNSLKERSRDFLWPFNFAQEWNWANVPFQDRWACGLGQWLTIRAKAFEIFAHFCTTKSFQVVWNNTCAKEGLTSIAGDLVSLTGDWLKLTSYLIKQSFLSLVRF